MEKYLQDGLFSGTVSITTGLASGLINDIFIMLLIALITSIVIPLIRFAGEKLIEWLKSKGMDQKDAEVILSKIKDKAVQEILKQIECARKKNDTKLLEALEKELKNLKEDD